MGLESSSPISGLMKRELQKFQEELQADVLYAEKVDAAAEAVSDEEYWYQKEREEYLMNTGEAASVRWEAVMVNEVPIAAEGPSWL